MENEEKRLIAIRIKELRREHKLKQKELGEMLGVTESAVSRWEAGQVENMKRDVIVSLSDKFNVSALWLMGFDAPKQKQTQKESELIKQIDEKLLWLDEKGLTKVLKFIEEFL